MGSHVLEAGSCQSDQVRFKDEQLLLLSLLQWPSGHSTRVRVHLQLFRCLGNFVRPTLSVSFGRDTKSCWSLLPGVYARGIKDPTQGVNV